MRCKYFSHSQQQGAALLVAMLILIITSAFVLVRNLNIGYAEYPRRSENLKVLNEAKASLIGYAINYPLNHSGKGPGYLPCPDISNNGSAGGSCALSPNATTIGRIPWKTLELDHLRDYTGETLWYAVADNFRNNPGLDVLNSETTAQFILDGNASSDIAAIIFAPGPPHSAQDRSIDPLDVTNYLEDDNANGDVNFVSQSSNDFNDTLVVITRRELMEAVEKRVLGEVGTLLNDYKTAQGAYPWLTPFADPKTIEKRLTGQHTGSNNQANLTDSSADFTQWGVTNGNVVWNITDGSYGLVTNVSSTTLTIGAGMRLGTDNDFDTDDEYFVDVAAVATAFTGTATGGTTNLVLEDTNKNYIKLGVQIGEVVELVADGSSGVINDVSSNKLTVSALSGATNSFSFNDVYRIRSSIGRATSSGGLTLNDTNVDFSVMGIQTGDLIRNITDGSFGRVTAVAANSLTVGELIIGTNNTFNANDYYALPRYNGETNTRQGLLSFHEPGEVFKTGFSIDWHARASNGTVVVSTQPAVDPKPEYANISKGIKEWAEASDSNNSGTIIVSDTDGQCVWVNSTVADCTGKYVDSAFLSGIVSSVSSGAFDDSTIDFADAGVSVGDKVENLDNGTKGLVDSVSSSRVYYTNITGQTALSIAANNAYRISVATSTTTDTVDLYNDSSNLVLAYSLSYSDIEIGDVVENVSRGGAVGLISDIICCYSGYQYFQYTQLQGGSNGDLYPGDTFEIHHNYVDKREYEFNVRINGDSSITSPSAVRGFKEITTNGVRQRNICMGYGSDCTGSASNTTLPGDSITPLVTIRDYDSSDVLVGDATSTIPAAGAPGRVKISGINFFLSKEYDDIPSWFIENGWHKLVYFAYSAGDAPGAATACVAGTDCLTLNGAGSPDDDKQALVIAAGAAINTTLDSTCSNIASIPQNRVNGTINEYYESENCNADDTFQMQSVISTFNDQVQIIEP